MKVQDQTLLMTELVTSDEDYLIPLTEDEQDCIQGGIVAGIAAGAAIATLGWVVYEGYTTREQRIEHAEFIGRSVGEVAEGVGRGVRDAVEVVEKLAPRYA